jgi:AraC family transcriptional regulator
MLEIDPSHLQQTLTEEARGAKIELSHLLAVPDRQIKLLMTAMQEDLGAGASAGKLYGESLGNAIAVYIVGRYSTSTLKFEKFKGGLTKAQLNHVRDYIEQHIDGNPGLQELARIAGLSIYHFAKQFRHSTGFAPHQYLLQRKIERAKEFLRDPRRSVLEASVRAGFVDQSHFGKMFRRMVGVTPTEFRSRI